MHQAIVIGSSAGGLFALTSILDELPHDYPLPVIIIQHRVKERSQLLEEILQQRCRITVKQADEKEDIRSGVVYIAPPGYHLLIENDKTFSLASDIPEKHSMPSIDVLFETAAYCYQQSLIAIILTGASNDGSDGMRITKKLGGLTIAQDPNEAQFPYMPRAAISIGAASRVMTLDEIKHFLLTIRIHDEKG
jgi:two-component system, chemotaxis family, protein-glutamate methylesterase/glutaminase